MALVDCVECKGVVSDVAAACPHCGHPNPAQGIRLQAFDPADQRIEAAAVPPEVRLFWRVILWATGFFVLGVFVDTGVEAAGIGISGDWIGWSSDYRSSWFSVLLPYATAALGAFIGLARRRGDTWGPFAYISLGLSLVLATGIGVVLLGAAEEAARGGARHPRCTINNDQYAADYDLHRPPGRMGVLRRAASRGSGSRFLSRGGSAVRPMELLPGELPGSH